FVPHPSSASHIVSTNQRKESESKEVAGIACRIAKTGAVPAGEYQLNSAGRPTRIPYHTGLPSTSLQFHPISYRKETLVRKPLISTFTPIFCLAVLLLIVLKFSLVHVIGISMWPTIQDNQFAV